MPQPPDPSSLGLSFTAKIHSDTYTEIDPARNPAPCAGKSVLVTGAAKGIGRAIVVSYAKAGASRIAITSRDGEASATREEAERAAADAGRADLEILVVALDVCNYASIEACAARIRDVWGTIDVLVNNAGYLSPFEPLGEGDKDDWWKTWEVNVRGVYWVIHAMLPLLLESGDRTVVNLTSVGALAMTPGASAYQPSKLAVMRITEYLMGDYGDQGLLAYSVHPASVATDLANRMPNAIVKAVCKDTPELAGDTIAYLTRERREWLAGRYVSCSWDMPELMGRQSEIADHDLLRLKMVFTT